MSITNNPNQTQKAARDWTQGGDTVYFQHCLSCQNIWYFHRSFCPNCGSQSPVSQAANARGSVFATTLVYRAPSAEFSAIVPYRIVLVDMQEGFRMMGHGELELTLDMPVICDVRTIAGRALPFFSQLTPMENS